MNLLVLFVIEIRNQDITNKQKEKEKSKKKWKSLNRIDY